jgi:hypothetical protein
MLLDALADRGLAEAELFGDPVLGVALFVDPPHYLLSVPIGAVRNVSSHALFRYWYVAPTAQPDPCTFCGVWAHLGFNISGRPPPLAKTTRPPWRQRSGHPYRAGHGCSGPASWPPRRGPVALAPAWDGGRGSAVAWRTCGACVAEVVKA